MLSNIYSFQAYKKNKSNTQRIYFGTSIAGFPRAVETGVSKNCNLKCFYCPNSLIKKTTAEHTMPLELFEKILSDLKKIDFDGVFAFHRYNEPLLVEVEKYIKKVKEILPKVRTELATNGTSLNAKRLEKLYSAGIDKIIVTQHTPKGFIDKLGEIPDDLLKRVDVLYSEELSLVNRAGAFNPLDNPLNKSCYSVNKRFCINSDGRVPVCVDDFYEEVILGDVKNNSIEEIWNSPYSQEIRKKLSMGDRTFLDLCKRCDRTEANRQINFDLEKNKALYRKRLLEEYGSAHLPSYKKDIKSIP